MAKSVRQQITETYFAADGVTPLYGAGELVPEGTELPPGVRTRDVVVDEDGLAEAVAPVPAQEPEHATAEADRAREVERIQTERSQPRTDQRAAEGLAEGDLGDVPVEASPGSLGASAQPAATAAAGTGDPGSGQGSTGQQPSAQSGSDAGQGAQTDSGKPAGKPGTSSGGKSGTK